MKKAHADLLEEPITYRSNCGKNWKVSFQYKDGALQV